MNRPRITPELIVGVLIVAFIAVTVVRPWGGDAAPSPSVPPTPAVTAGARATTPPPTPGIGPQAVPGQIVASVPIAGTPASPVVDGDDIWYQTGPGSLSRLNAETLAVDRIALDSAVFPGEVEVTAHGGELWIAGAVDQSISRIDTTTGRVIAQLPLIADGPYTLDGVFGLVRGASMLWAIGDVRWMDDGDGAAPSGSACCDNLDTSELFRVDLAASDSFDVHQVDGATAIAVGFGSVWVFQTPRESSGRAILVRRDPGTGIATGTTVLPDPGVDAGCDRCLAGIEIGAGSVWMAYRGLVLRVDSTFQLISAQIKVVGQITDLTTGPDGSLWIVGEHDPVPDCRASGGFLARIDPYQNVVSGELAVSCPVSVAVSAGDVWVGTDALDGPKVLRVRRGS